MNTVSVCMRPSVDGSLIPASSSIPNPQKHEAHDTSRVFTTITFQYTAVLMMSQVAAKAALRQIIQGKATKLSLFSSIHTKTWSRSTGSVSITSFHDNHRSQNRTFSQSRNISKSRGASSTIPDETGKFVDTEMDDIEDFKAAEDMDYYDPLAEEYYPADEEDTEETDEVEETKRQAVRDKLDTKTGRLWEDRLEFTDEDWSTGKSFEDLADWSEEICSRVSRDRVKVHPGESVFLNLNLGDTLYISFIFSFAVSNTCHRWCTNPWGIGVVAVATSDSNSPSSRRSESICEASQECHVQFNLRRS